MVTVFFYYQGVLLLDFKKPGVNINAERYADSLKRLRVSIKNKRPGSSQMVSFFCMVMLDPI